jgi:hypothetical protein
MAFPLDLGAVEDAALRIPHHNPMRPAFQMGLSESR